MKIEEEITLLKERVDNFYYDIKAVREVCAEKADGAVVTVEKIESAYGDMVRDINKSNKDIAEVCDSLSKKINHHVEVDRDEDVSAIHSIVAAKIDEGIKPVFNRVDGYRGEVFKRLGKVESKIEKAVKEIENNNIGKVLEAVLAATKNGSEAKLICDDWEMKFKKGKISIHVYTGIDIPISTKAVANG